MADSSPLLATETLTVIALLQKLVPCLTRSYRRTYKSTEIWHELGYSVKSTDSKGFPHGIHNPSGSGN